MKMKSICTLLMVALFLSTVAVLPAYADSSPSISVTTTTMDTNGEFSAIVSISNNPGIAYFSLRLHFDTTKIEPLSITKGTALPNGSVTSNLSNLTTTYITAVWSDADGTEENGTLYTVKFKMKDGASGTSELNLSAHGIFDISDDMNPVSFALSGTEIELTNFGEVPKTGVADMTGAITAMLVLFAISVVLWGYVLRRRLSRSSNG